jgi:hypothetical protein
MEASAPTTDFPVVGNPQSKVEMDKKRDYTAFDRDLIKAQQRKTELTFWMVARVPESEEVRGMYVLFAVPESIDKFMVKVKAQEREIWLAKQYILAVELKGRV